MSRLPDGSGFFIVDIDQTQPIAPDPVYWNPYNKVVQDHRDGTIDHEATNLERARRGLPVPWVPRMAETEVHEPPI